MFYFKVSSDLAKEIVPIIKRQQKAKNNLILVKFTTLAEYLYNLKEIALILQKFGSNSMLYLAAAVSDFYIPPANMVSFNIILLICLTNLFFT